MSSPAPSRPKRARKPSKCAKRAQGLPSDSKGAGSDSSGSGRASDDDASKSASFIPPPVPLERSQSTTSLASQSSMASVGAKVDDEKRAKFDERYKTATLSDEEVLKKQMEQWTSEVYKHFKMPPAITVKKGEVVYLYSCIAHPSITVSRVRHNESTGNLGRHVRNCLPADSSQTRALAAFASGSRYSIERHRVNIALWVSSCHRPFSIVEDAPLLEIFSDLNPNCVTPKRRSVSRDVKEIFHISRKEFAALLRKCPNKLDLIIDGWTSPNFISFVGGDLTWYENGRMRSAILDFIKASKAHTGVYLAARIAECLREYGIEDKILTLTADNASNNNTLVEELAELIPSFGGKEYRVRCFAHILNLVVKAILSQFDRKFKPAANGNAVELEVERQLDLFEQELTSNGDGIGDEEPPVDPDNDDEIADDVAASDTLAVNAAICEADDSIHLDPLPSREANLGRVSIAKLRALANKIVNSPTIREDLQACCRQVKIDPKQMIRDVSTHWNSTAELIQRALELAPALKILVVKAEYNKVGHGVRLARFQLSTEEWKLLEDLSLLLDIFLFATKEISQSATPLIHQVIPIFDIITTALEDKIDDSSLPLAVHHSALRGYFMLNKYYSLTDESIVYRIAMILHPRYKTSYFTRAKWPQDWISAAEAITRKVWTKDYKKTAPPRATQQPAVGTSSRADTHRFAAARRYFSSLRDDSTPIDALDEWLNSPIVNTLQDPISYWAGMEAAGHPLALMALDFLSIPASSTDVERSFSKGRLTVTKLCHSLSDESTRASTVLGLWTDLPGVIPKEDIIRLFKEKCKRPKGKEKAREERSSNVIIVD